MTKCEGCRKDVSEVCKDGFCKDCHVTCSWEDCITGTFEARHYLTDARRAGIPAKDVREYVLRMYPKAKI